MITKDVKNMWVDKQGNTCFGIKPEPEKVKEKKEPVEEEIEEVEVGEEGPEHDSKKTAKSNRRKRS